MSRNVSILLLITGLIRWLVASRTEIPSHDAGAYLWMAERVAEGDLGAAFSTVFHPLYSLLTGGLLALAPIDPVLAGQWVACGLATLAVWPLYAIALRLFDVRTAWITGLFYASGLWLARHPADCLSEGPFFLFVTTALWAMFKSEERRLLVALAGVAAALAYATRPEGAAIILLAVPWLLVAQRRRDALVLSIAFAVSAVWFPIGWMVYGEGFVLSPKGDFNFVEGVGSKDLWHYPLHMLRMFGTAFEAIGYLVFPLALYGMTGQKIEWKSRRALLLGIVVLQCLVIPMLRSNIRFLAGFGILLLPFAAQGFVLLTARIPGRAWMAIFLLIVVSPDLARLPAIRREDRVVLRELGEFLQDRCEAGDFVATEEARLAYFAGMPPIPPRKMTREDLLAACSRARFAVVIPARTGITRQELNALGLTQMVLPPEVAEQASVRALMVYERR